MRNLFNALAILSFCIIAGILLGSLFTLGLAEIAVIIRPLRALIDWRVALLTCVSAFTALILVAIYKK